MTRVLDGKSDGRELTECLMKHELSDAVEATAQAIEERVSETNLDPKASYTSYFTDWLPRCFSVFETVRHQRGGSLL